MHCVGCVDLGQIFTLVLAVLSRWSTLVILLCVRLCRKSFDSTRNATSSGVFPG